MGKTAETEQQASQIEALLQSDPTLTQLRAQAQQLRAHPGRTGKGDAQFAAQMRQINIGIADRLGALGVPLPHDYAVNVRSGDVDYQNWLERNWQSVVVTGILAAGTWGVASALAPATTVATPGATAPGYLAEGLSDGVVPAAATSTAGAVAPAVAPAVATAATQGFNWRDALRYGAPIVAGAVDSVNANRNANANREENQRESNQRTAVDESKLDPFRGQMFQIADAGEMERRLAGPRTYRPAAGSPYASSYNPANEPPPLSADYRSGLTNAQQNILRGQGTVPTMLNEANWGKTGTMDLTTPAAPPAPGASTPGAAAPPVPGAPWPSPPTSDPGAMYHPNGAPQPGPSLDPTAAIDPAAIASPWGMTEQPSAPQPLAPRGRYMPLRRSPLRRA